MFLNDAHAQTTATAPATATGEPPSPFVGMLPLLLVFVVFYFLLIRPQQKKFKDHQATLGAIKKGDKILTGGGIYGIVTKLEGDNDLQVEIANGVTVTVAKSTVSAVMVDKPANDNA